MKRFAIPSAIVLSALTLYGVSALRLPGEAQTASVTMTGCVERDAAARVPLFKLVVTQPDGGSRLYQLNAPANVDLPAAVGKIAEATGTVAIEKRGGRDVHVLTVRAFKIVAARCGAS